MKIYKRNGVAPVLATLLMIAVAVAMSVIIFMWAQGFLSNTSSATGSQQGSQNIAAQSSIAIESITHITQPTTFTTIHIRNVGAVTVTLGSCIIQGISSNTAFTGSSITTFTAVSLSKGSAYQSIIQTIPLVSGDVLTAKCTTTAGTFASSQYLVP